MITIGNDPKLPDKNTPPTVVDPEAFFDEPPESPEIEIDLRFFDDDYDAAETNEQIAPTGTYIVRVEQFLLGIAKTSGNPKLTWKVMVVQGPHTVKVLWKNSTITGEMIRNVKQDIERMEVKTPRFSALQSEKTRSLFIEIFLEVKKEPQKSNPNYYNAYINRRIKTRNDSINNPSSSSDLIPF